MNSKFNIENMELDGVKLITPFYVEDNRGYMMKVFEKNTFHEWNLENDIYEVFLSKSKKNVIRGLHFQTNNPQIKIVNAVCGKIWDVVVDLRIDSMTYGKWLAVELSEENKKLLYIPRGFAHGFKVLSDEALVEYQCIGRYDKESDTGIMWNDKELDINWGIDYPIISERDRNLMTFRNYTEILRRGGE